MANLLSYNDIIDILKDLAQRHYQLNTFFLGRDWELENNQDIVYPLMQIYPSNARMPITIGGDYKTVEINLVCKIVDLVAQGEANEKDVHSDTLRIAQDVVNSLNQHPFYIRSNVALIGDIVFSNLEEYEDDFAAGWSFNLNLRLINNNSYCGLPMADLSGYTANGPISSGYSTSVQYLTCATVTGCTSLQNYITNSIGPAISGGTYISSSSTISFTTIGGNTYEISGITSGGAFTGGTVTGATDFTGGLTANQISATTYYNIPTVFGTGANNNGGTITTGVTGYFVAGHAGRITGWELIGATSGSIVFDIWKTTGSTLPTVANSITDAAKPRITAGVYSGSTNLSAWSGLTYNAGDKFGFNIDSVSGFTTVTLTIKGFKSN